MLLSLPYLGNSSLFCGECQLNKRFKRLTLTSNSIIGAHEKVALLPKSLRCFHTARSKTCASTVLKHLKYSFKIFCCESVKLTFALHSVPVSIPKQVCKGHRHNFLSSTQVNVCFLMTSTLYTLSPALLIHLSARDYQYVKSENPCASPSQQQTAVICIRNYRARSLPTDYIKYQSENVLHFSIQTIVSLQV